jgi:hypothetical protein
LRAEQRQERCGIAGLRTRRRHDPSGIASSSRCKPTASR